MPSGPIVRLLAGEAATGLPLASGSGMRGTLPCNGGTSAPPSKRFGCRFPVGGILVSAGLTGESECALPLLSELGFEMFVLFPGDTGDMLDECASASAAPDAVATSMPL